MNIVLLGSGNVATHLGKALKLAGHSITEVWSRTFQNAQVLASLLQSEPVINIEDISRDADIYIISVNDDAISFVAGAIPVKDKLVIHTSGSAEMNVLGALTHRYGVLYPLQTFSKEQNIDFRKIPIVLEASSESVGDVLKELAVQLSPNVQFLNFEQRHALHVAAVFACNFTNHLYALAENLLKTHGLDFSLIKPLIAETAGKIQHNSPRNVQTGPAKRRDEKIIAKHLELLKGNSELYDLYKLLSQSIVNLN